VRKKFYLFYGIIISLFLSGCALEKATSNNPPHTLEADTVSMDEFENIEVLSDLSASTPFNVQIDKTSLEIRKEKEVTVIISTDLTEWSYSASAENGTVSNTQKNSFTYTIPKDETTRTDTILIQLSDYENGILYKYNIPLLFALTSETVSVSSDGIE